MSINFTFSKFVEAGSLERRVGQVRPLVLQDAPLDVLQGNVPTVKGLRAGHKTGLLTKSNLI